MCCVQTGSKLDIVDIVDRTSRTYRLVLSSLQVFSATSPDNTTVIDSGDFVTPVARTNVTQALQYLVDQTYYTVWLAAEDMQSPPLQQSTATRVIWEQPYLIAPQMNASIASGSTVLGDR